MRVKAFDIFNTILARTVQESTDIFDIIELTFPYDNFKKIRIHAQEQAELHSKYTLDDIYVYFKYLSGDDDDTMDKLQEYEILTEMKHTIPIVSNCLKINDYDILINDTYLHQDDVYRILKYHEIDNDVNLYMCAGEKTNNVKKYVDKLSEHIISKNIYKFTELEKLLYVSNSDLCTLFRTFRLADPYDEGSIEHKLYNQQITYNIPLLIFMCKKLANILTNENKNTVLFLSRDGCLIIKLFKCLYPQYKAVYFHSSRYINNHYSDEYMQYVKKTYNKKTCILFDLHGAFESGRGLFIKLFGELPRIFIFDLTSKSHVYDKLTYITNASSIIETFNPDLVGSLCKYTNKTDIRLPLEHRRDLVQLVHKTVENFIDFLKTNDLISFILKEEIFNNTKFWSNYYKNIARISKILLNNMHSHSIRTLSYLCNIYSFEKKNKLSHIYEEIIDDIINKNGVDSINLLEIGINKDNKLYDPLMMWHDYFNGTGTFTGFTKKSFFLKYNNIHDNIHFKVGNQSKQRDLLQLKDKNYNLIIDSGYYSSKHQQISFKILWDNLEPGGYYVIEDLYYHRSPESSSKTKILFENWSQGNFIETDYIDVDDITYIANQIDIIKFYDSKSKTCEKSFVSIRKIK